MRLVLRAKESNKTQLFLLAAKIEFLDASVSTKKYPPIVASQTVTSALTVTSGWAWEDTV